MSVQLVDVEEVKKQRLLEEARVTLEQQNIIEKERLAQVGVSMSLSLNDFTGVEVPCI